MMSVYLVHVQARVWSCNSKYVLFPVFISLLSLFVYSFYGRGGVGLLEGLDHAA